MVSWLPFYSSLGKHLDSQLCLSVSVLHFGKFQKMCKEKMKPHSGPHLIFQTLHLENSIHGYINYVTKLLHRLLFYINTNMFLIFLYCYLLVKLVEYLILI